MSTCSGASCEGLEEQQPAVGAWTIYSLRRGTRRQLASSAAETGSLQIPVGFIFLRVVPRGPMPRVDGMGHIFSLGGGLMIVCVSSSPGASIPRSEPRSSARGGARRQPAIMAKRTREESVVLVTGGSGLVGKGIQAAVEREGRSGERWVYLNSKDGDLRCVNSSGHGAHTHGK